ncbi:alpha-2-macroglobulin-like isoform X3 [Leguminivora glycinivorella]|uniref:alpha-2-macroglobulin-like isoform X3 n=1 Tax=Leguminivora glycinivorella TaxID=1035111 RepID=UPI00200EB72B|nr:alpha-2-macroglobulin-like isoform X3 [Leguminivora glycinivorella]
MPGDTIRARALVLKADLAPVHGSIEEMWLEGPPGAWEGTRAAQWNRVRTRLGFGQIQHELDAQAPPGRWTLRAKLEDGSQGSTEFIVGNYEIPPFQLSVKHAARVLRTSERLVWTVCVRYPWTEAVEGMLVIRLRGAGVNFSTDTTPGVRTAVRLRAPKACHRHAVAARRIGLDGGNPPDVVVADFSFQEEGTRIWQNTTVVSQVVDKAVTLQFLTKHRVVLAPGLPYKLKIKATRWDDKPAANEHVRLCRSAADRSETCDDAVTDGRGVARAMFTVDDNANALYKFEATLKNDSSTAAPPLYLPVRRTGSIHAALGPLRGDTNARSFVPLYLSKDVDTSLSVHFVVITRGGTIYRWGVTTQCPISSSTNQIHAASRNSKCPHQSQRSSDLQTKQFHLSANSSGFIHQSEGILDRHLLRVMLPIKMTHQMCPDSHLVAYFYYRGELVSAVKHIEMEECFVNKVELAWLSRQVAPGASASLSITTNELALCGLSVLDSASRWLAPVPSAKESIMERLRSIIESHRNLTEYDASGKCYLTSDEESPPSSSILTHLAEGGVRVAGGVMHACAPAPAPAPLREQVQPRTDFSEAWLWRLVAVGVNGTVITSARAPDSITRYEATALCVSRNGLAVSPPASIQVFREFFIHADGPKRLKRGDSTIIQYRIFNYLYESLNIEIQVLADPHLEVPDRPEVAAMPARASVTRRVTLRAALPGSARLAIRARAPAQGVSDEIIIQIQVDPEGVPAQDFHSALLCGPGSEVSSTSEVSWSWPKVEAIPGSESVTVWAIGDIAGPLLADADSLVLLPRGCGEQNMARLATNLLALKQLDPKSPAASSAKEHVARGFTRQLQYAHPSGGFSAFGSSDDPSTWLTAFALKYLRKSHEVVSPGMPPPPVLRRAERWLMSQQMENGCFRNEGQVFHRELKGGLNEDGEIANVALTAYVITSLVEGVSDLPYRVLKNTLHCLRALPPLKTKSPNRVYAHAVLAYAFMRLRRYEEELRKSNEASPGVEGLEDDEDIRELVELMRMARRTEELVWWEASSLATSVEATGYALLALTSCPHTLRASCAHDARAATRWLSAQRRAQGGFVATQDTLVALEALTSWAASQPPGPTHLTVTVKSGSATSSVLLTPEAKVPEFMKVAVGKLEVNVEGSGCALIQATRAYHTLSPGSSESLLSVQVSVRTDGAFNCDNDTNCFCAAVVEACVVWTGEFPEMALLDITLPSGFGADAALLYAQLQKTDTLLPRIELSPSAGRATLYLAARGGRLHGAHRCFTVHAVGPAAATKPAYVRVQDYYVPAHNDTQMYTIPEDCPSRISQRSNDYLRSDNLFTKSLSEDGEILINDEFTFEDVPDGIPLEDPIYDNLTKKDATENKNVDGNKPSNIEEDNLSKKYETEKENIQEDNLKMIDEPENKNISENDPINVEEDSLKKKDEKEYKHTNPQTSDLEGNKGRIPKLESENEIIRIDDKIERNFDDIEDTNVNPGIKYNNTSIEISADDSETEAQSKEVKTEHRIEIRDDTKQEEQVDNPKLSSFHVINSDKDLDVPEGIEGPVPVSVLPPPNFVSVTPNTAPNAFSSVPVNPKAFYSYPPYSYYVFSEPRHRYIYKR